MTYQVSVRCSMNFRLVGKVLFNIKDDCWDFFCCFGTIDDTVSLVVGGPQIADELILVAEDSQLLAKLSTYVLSKHIAN